MAPKLLDALPVRRVWVHYWAVVTYELLGVDDDGKSFRLAWSDSPDWAVQRQTTPDEWVDLGTFSETLPVRALPFARWLGPHASPPRHHRGFRRNPQREPSRTFQRPGLGTGRKRDRHSYSPIKAGYEPGSAQ